jgi:hypothetical protein
LAIRAGSSPAHSATIQAQRRLHRARRSAERSEVISRRRAPDGGARTWRAPAGARHGVRPR